MYKLYIYIVECRVNLIIIYIFLILNVG